MTLAVEPLIAALLSLGLAVVLAFVSLRAYRRTGNAGFVFIALALVVVPQVSGLVDHSIHEWLRDRVGEERSRSDSMRLYHAVRLSLTAVLLSAGLVMLSQRSRRRPAEGARSER